MPVSTKGNSPTYLKILHPLQVFVRRLPLHPDRISDLLSELDDNIRSKTDLVEEPAQGTRRRVPTGQQDGNHLVPQDGPVLSIPCQRVKKRVPVVSLRQVVSVLGTHPDRRLDERLDELLDPTDPVEKPTPGHHPRKLPDS